MTKIAFFTDSNCDIPLETARELGIEILPFTITIDGVQYKESYSFTPAEFYEKLISCIELPATAQISPGEFAAAFNRAFEGGYDCAVVTTMTSVGSGTYNSALVGRTLFYEERPEAEEKFDIYIYDSRNYSISHGYGILRAARAYKAGAELAEVLELIESWYANLETCFSVFTLKYVSRSGRISGAVQTVCDMLGLCPIMENINGIFRTFKTPRGRKAAVRAIAQRFYEHWDGESDYVILRGITDTEALALAQLLEEHTGKPPAGIFYAGASISTNTGPYIAGVGFTAKKEK
ncbi:MAG: DegV family protein [Candidatus Heteroscillospira sp.]|jgi:DegV family protein with EDD domain